MHIYIYRASSPLSLLHCTLPWLLNGLVSSNNTGTYSILEAYDVSHLHQLFTAPIYKVAQATYFIHDSDHIGFHNLHLVLLYIPLLFLTTRYSASSILHGTGRALIPYQYNSSNCWNYMVPLWNLVSSHRFKNFNMYPYCLHGRIHSTILIFNSMPRYLNLNCMYL